MDISANNIIIILTIIIILSYLMDIISRSIRIPSVILLIGLGIALKFIFGLLSQSFLIPHHTLEIFGTTGLILIVLEASLDLNVTTQELPVMKKAFLTALAIFACSTISIALLIQYLMESSFRSSLIASIPLAVISSAIAIPSVASMQKAIKNFIIYEATFSDIIGILIFNYTIQENPVSGESVRDSIINIFEIIIISLVCSIIMVLIMNKITHHIKFFLILSMLLLIYSLGKIFHLPSLLLILSFGLLINNLDKFSNLKIYGHINPDKFKNDLISFKGFTAEIAFVIRTFFFVLFGFSINLDTFGNLDILYQAGLIILLSILIRYLLLRLMVRKEHQMTKLFLAPRGLITILLFYSIPEKYVIKNFSSDIVFLFILVSALLMMISLWMGKREGDLDEINEQL
jgi:Kef-type K+ transport system membrane component KefB